jgi:hypothetical protein
VSPNGRRRIMENRGTRPWAWKSIDDAFFRFFSKEPGCWLWTGPVNRDGYGRVSYRGHRVLAHRFSWEHHNQEIPAGLDALHHCDTPACVNPSHLFLGTPRDNNADMRAKRRHAHGPRHHWYGLSKRGTASASAKLTEAAVRQLRNMYEDKSIRTVDIAASFGISGSTVTKIAIGESWSHIVPHCEHRRPAARKARKARG